MTKNLCKALLLVIICSNNLYSQEKAGVIFDNKLNWKEIVQKAKREHKYIFIDCYATWCGPCKEMDRDVYPSSELGNEFNSKFISVKLQMDKTAKDNEYLKSWYSIADDFQKNYNLQGYPSFLFFSPNGKLVHRSLGYKSKEALISLGKAALDPNKQYFALLGKYKKGKITSEKDIKNFMNVARENGDKSISNEVAEKYK
jgi:thioredoxin-related protein